MESVKQLTRHLNSLLRRRGRSQADADDLIQEAFLRLHLYCQEAEVKQQEAFLVRTALNLSVDLHRKEHRDLYRDAPVEAMAFIDGRPTLDEMVAVQQRLAEATAVLDRLGPRTREIFLMHRLEGYGCAQIAAQFGISVSAVEKHIARAVLSLMELVERR